MHKFYWTPGDYARRTVGITPMQDIAYRRLLDAYYLNEGPPSGTIEEVAESVGLYDPDEPDASYLPAVKSVLRRYFDWRDGAWHHQHADEYIADFNLHAALSVKGGVTSGAVRKQQAALRKLAKLEAEGKPLPPIIGNRPTKDEAPFSDVGQTPTKVEPPLNHKKPETRNLKTPPAPTSLPPLAPAPPPRTPAAPSPAPAPIPPTEPEKAPKRPKTGALAVVKPMGKDYVPPDWVPADLWQKFVDHRLSLKSIPFTLAAAETNVQVLLKYRAAGLDVAAALQKTVANSWRGVPPPDERSQRAGYKTALEKKADATFELTEGIRRYGNGGKQQQPEPRVDAIDMEDPDAPAQ